MKKSFFKKVSLLAFALIIGLFGVFPMTAYADDSDPDLVMVDSGEHSWLGYYDVRFQTEEMSLSVTEMYVNDQKLTQVLDDGSSVFVNNTYYVKPEGFLEPVIKFKVDSLAVGDEVKFKNGNGTYVFKVINASPGMFGKLLDHNYTLVQDPKYAIQVNHGVAQFEGSNVTEMTAGETVTLVADSPEANYHFRNWDMGTSGVTLDDETAATTTFTMPAEDVTVTALYTKQVNFTVEDWEYGDDPSEPVFADSADEPDGAVELSFVGTGDTTFPEQDTLPTEPGTYRLTMNYTKTVQGETQYYEGSCDFEITKATLDISVEDINAVFGETIPMDGLTIILEGALEEDADTMIENLEVSEASQMYFDQEDPVPVGVYAIELEQLDHPVWENYNVQLHDGTLTVREPEMVEYVITAGANQELFSGDAAESIVIDGDLAYFVGVWVDGEEIVMGTDYTAISGSTIVTFSKDFVDSLSVGTHEILFKYTNGQVGTQLTILAKDSMGDKPGTVTKVNGDDKDHSAKTGDDSPMAMVLIFLALSAAGMVGLRKKGLSK